MNRKPPKVKYRSHTLVVSVVIFLGFFACAAEDQSQDSTKIFEDTAYRIKAVRPEDDALRENPVEVPRISTALRVVLKPRSQFLLRDPEGRRVGYDATADTTFQEIPGEPYWSMGLGVRPDGGGMTWTEAGIHNPRDGDYRVTLTEISHREYVFTTTYRDYDGDNVPLSTRFSFIPVDTLVAHSYTISLGTVPYAPYEVTGGFAGSVNEPAEIDRLLSYVNVSENITSLPAGIDRFNLILIYGGLAKPNTFSATLNDEDASDLFTPVDGGYEIVAIPLKPGNNLLELSVVGHTPDGAAADTDSLLFVVE